MNDDDRLTDFVSLNVRVIIDDLRLAQRLVETGLGGANTVEYLLAEVRTMSGAEKSVWYFWAFEGQALLTPEEIRLAASASIASPGASVWPDRMAVLTEGERARAYSACADPTCGFTNLLHPDSPWRRPGEVVDHEFVKPTRSGASSAS